MDDNSPQTEYIRSSASYHGRERRDTVLVPTGLGLRAAKIHMIFECEFQKQTWQLARISYYAPVGVDRDPVIGQWLVEALATYDFIELASVDRACHLIPAFDDHTTHHYLNDLIDPDMYLRLGAPEYAS